MKKISIYYLFASAIGGVLLTLLYINFSSNSKEQNILQPNTSNISSSNDKEIIKDNTVPTYCDYNFHRLKGYKYIKPLLDGEPECESNKLSSLKGEIMGYIENEKKAGFIAYTSVYLKNLSTNDWMVINPSQGFHPGSLIKVAVLITYLRMAETNPNLLNNQIDYTKDNTIYPKVEFKSDTIILGNKYRIKDLLYFMIANSDNRATVVLENYMDIGLFRKTFTDLGMPELSFSDTSYRITAKRYSNFFSVIYNAGLVSSKSSELAATILSESTFREGLVKLLPEEIKVAHKFGEWGNGFEKELHETGIIYINDNPYILTVMTNGNDWKSLSTVMSQISKIVYDKMAIAKHVNVSDGY